MPGSSDRVRLKNTLLALRNVAFLLFLALSFTLVFSAVSKRLAYRIEYQFIPGQYTGRVLNDIHSEREEKQCIVVGASTAREGVDIARLSRLIPSTRFYSIATTASEAATGVLNMQASILKNFSRKFDCIVLGVHSFMLYRPLEGSVDSFKNDYVSQLTTNQVLKYELLESQWREPKWGQIVAHAVIPNARDASILRKHLFYVLYKIQSLIGINDRTLSAFELRQNELRSYDSQFLYLNKESRYTQRFIERRKRRLEQRDATNPDNYTSPVSLSLFRDTINILSGLTNRLIIVELPASPVFDTVNSVSAPIFERELAQFNGKFMHVQCDLGIRDPVEVFHDTIHVNERGREMLTDSLAALLVEDRTAAGVCVVKRN